MMIGSVLYLLLQLVHSQPNLIVEIAGTNGQQAQQPGCRCAELPPAWNGLRDAQPSLQSPAAPHLARDGPRQDQSGRESAEGSKTNVESLP